MNILEDWDISQYKGDILRHVSSSTPISVQHKVAEIKAKQCGTSDFKALHCLTFKIFEILCPILICFYLCLLISYKDVCCTQDEAMNPTFQRKYVPAFKHVCSWRSSLIRKIVKSPVLFSTPFNSGLLR